MSALLVLAKWFQRAWVLSTRGSICGKADRGPFAVAVSGIRRNCWSCSAAGQRSPRQPAPASLSNHPTVVPMIANKLETMVLLMS